MENGQRDGRNIRNCMARFRGSRSRQFRSMKNRCREIVERLNPLNMFIHDKSVNYLDLAVEPCNRYTRRDHVKFEAIRTFPPACAEYLITESEIPETSMFGKIFSYLDELLRSKLEQSNRNILDFKRNCYSDYTYVVLDRLEHLDTHQKRTSIRALLNTHKIFKINTFRSLVYRFLIRECVSPEPDATLTMEVLKTLCNTIQSKTLVFIDSPHETFESMLSHAKVMRFDFWGLWRGIGDFSTKFNPIAEFINIGTHPFVIILLKYGFPYLSNLQIYEKQCLDLNRKSLRNSPIISLDAYYHLRRIPNRHRMMLILTTFLALADFVDTGGIPAGAISTLVCLMRCVPDPYVTPNEMSFELKQFLLPETLRDRDTICDLYEDVNVFHEDYTVTNPRKLKHLCRCVIRRAIANNLRLPEGINELIIPTDFKTYLLLES